MIRMIMVTGLVFAATGLFGADASKSIDPNVLKSPFNGESFRVTINRNVWRSEPDESTASAITITTESYAITFAYEMTTARRRWLEDKNAFGKRIELPGKKLQYHNIYSDTEMSITVYENSPDMKGAGVTPRLQSLMMLTTMWKEFSRDTVNNVHYNSLDIALMNIARRKGYQLSAATNREKESDIGKSHSYTDTTTLYFSKSNSAD